MPFRILKARRTYAIRSVPNPLEFFGYVFCFSSILAGPAFEYSEYEACTNGKAYEKVRRMCIFSVFSLVPESTTWHNDPPA